MQLAKSRQEQLMYLVFESKQSFTGHQDIGKLFLKRLWLVPFYVLKWCETVNVGLSYCGFFIPAKLNLDPFTFHVHLCIFLDLRNLQA